MRYVIAVLAIGGIVVSCLALAEHYGAPAQPIDLRHSAWNSAYVNQSSFATVQGIPVASPRSRRLYIAGLSLHCSASLCSRSTLPVLDLPTDSTSQISKPTSCTCGVCIALSP